MQWSFIANSILLGTGLAMDAFSVSIANGLRDPGMSRGTMHRIAGTFAFFQFLMPMLGWFCVHSLLEAFTVFQNAIPWIALLLLCFIGGKMIYEGLHEKEDGEPSPAAMTPGALLVQGIATSIDALSTGFTIADYGASMAFLASVIIALVTELICLIGVRIGKRFGMKLARRASIFGGVILILIGLEIVIKSFLS